MAAADNFFRALQRLMNVNESVCICSWPFSVNNFRKKGKKVEIPNLYKKKATNVFSLHDYSFFYNTKKKVVPITGFQFLRLDSKFKLNADLENMANKGK